jgi:hypothetical protein
MPRAPLTEEQKQVLRDRLAKAREMKKSKPKLPPEPTVPIDKVEATTPFTPTPHTQWTERQWGIAPIAACKARLALLKVDFEVGARIVGQRPESNDPHTYRCFVCSTPIPESKWVWKQDYLDRKTGVYQSVVICNQTCHTRYINDVPMQRRMSELVAQHSQATP